MADMKKQDMAEAAEQLLVGTGWLPALMRTPRAAQEPAEAPQADAVTETKPRRVLRRRRVIGMAGTAARGPGLSSCGLSKFLAARPEARGQSHDAHALDRAHFQESETLFHLKPVGKARCDQRR